MSEIPPELLDQTFFGTPVTLAAGSSSLIGNLHLPPDAPPDKRHSAVLLLHGLGGNRHEHGGLFIKLASTLARNGIAAMRIDFRGSGETAGNTLDMRLSTQVEDTLTAFDYLAAMPEIDPGRIAILGLSFGGLTAAIAAQEREINGLVLWEAAYDMLTSMKNCWGTLSIKAIRARGYMQAGMMQISAEFFDELERLDIPAAVRGFRKPTLIVQGGQDRIVTADTAELWRKSLVSSAVELEILPEADHAFPRDDDAWRAIQLTTDWLTKL